MTQVFFLYSKVISYNKIIARATSNDELDAIAEAVKVAGFDYVDEENLLANIEWRRRRLSGSEMTEEENNG